MFTAAQIIYRQKFRLHNMGKAIMEAQKSSF